MTDDDYKNKQHELVQAAYNLRATVRLNVRNARERQLAVERIDEGLLWAMHGLARDHDIHSATTDALDGLGNPRQV